MASALATVPRKERDQLARFLYRRLRQQSDGEADFTQEQLGGEAEFYHPFLLHLHGPVQWVVWQEAWTRAELRLDGLDGQLVADAEGYYGPYYRVVLRHVLREFNPPRVRRPPAVLEHTSRLIPPASLSQLNVNEVAGPPPPSGRTHARQPFQKEHMPTGERWWAEDTEKWSRWVDWVTAETRGDYLRHLRTIPRWLARLGFELPTNAHDYTPDMVMAIAWDRERSGSTRQKALVVLKSYLTWKGAPLALNRRVWKETMGIDTTPHNRRWLSTAEVVKLTRAAFENERWSIVVGLALWGGLRQGEIRGLRVGDIDFGRHRILVRYGKGNRWSPLPLSTQAERLLEPLRALEDDYEPVYPYGRTTLARDLWAACERAGIARFSPHDLRRTCVRLTKAGGANPLGRQLLLRHKRAEQTRHYEGEDELEVQGAVDALSAFGERILEGE